MLQNKTSPTVYLSHINLSYQRQVLFDDLTLIIPAGKWIGLLGASGVGKSTLLRVIAGLMQANEKMSGTIDVDHGQPIQQQIAYMSQTDLLLPWLTVLENTLLGYKLRNVKHPEIRKKAIGLLKTVGLGSAIQLYPHQLSGGMRQRVALVRTLMEDKPIVLMDEPFSALDAITRYKLQNLTVELLHGKTVFFVTHDPGEALRLSNEIYLLQGRPAQLKNIVVLDSTIPRELSSPELSALEVQLFQELSKVPIAELTVTDSPGKPSNLDMSS